MCLYYLLYYAFSYKAQFSLYKYVILLANCLSPNNQKQLAVYKEYWLLNRDRKKFNKEDVF